MAVTSRPHPSNGTRSRNIRRQIRLALSSARLALQSVLPAPSNQHPAASVSSAHSVRQSELVRCCVESSPHFWWRPIVAVIFSPLTSPAPDRTGTARPRKLSIPRYLRVDRPEPPKQPLATLNQAGNPAALHRSDAGLEPAASPGVTARAHKTSEDPPFSASLPFSASALAKLPPSSQILLPIRSATKFFTRAPLRQPSPCLASLSSFHNPSPQIDGYLCSDFLSADRRE